jgi:hypothetical protein
MTATSTVSRRLSRPRQAHGQAQGGDQGLRGCEEAVWNGTVDPSTHPAALQDKPVGRMELPDAGRQPAHI